MNANATTLPAHRRGSDFVLAPRAHRPGWWRSQPGFGLRWRAAGPAVVVGSVGANLVISSAATRFLGANASFPLLGPVHVALVSAAAAAGAVGVFALLSRKARRPRLLFRRLALAVLIASFLPDLALLLGPGGRILGASPIDIGVLALMHLPPAALSVGLLSGLTSRDEGGEPDTDTDTNTHTRRR